MDGIMNKPRFAMERFKQKMKTEKKQIQSNRSTIKKERNKKQKKLSKKGIEEVMRQHEINKKRELKIKRKKMN